MSYRQEARVWTVRNLKGQFIGTYRAYTARQAIDRLIQDQMATASQFRRFSIPSHSDFTAVTEARETPQCSPQDRPLISAEARSLWRKCH